MTQTATHGDAPDVDQLSESERHRLLSNERRRLLLDVLADETVSDLDGLSAAVAEREGDSDPPDGERLRRVRVALCHKHLPYLAELNVVDYDRENQRIQT